MAAVPPRLMISFHVEEERGVTKGRRTRDMTAKSTSFAIKDVSMFLEPPHPANFQLHLIQTVS